MTTFDTSTALLIVDTQNDFAHPDGSLYVKGGEDILPFINDQIRAARDAGALVVYTQDWHPPTTPHFEKDGGTWPVHCVKDTWGSEFHPDLLVIEDAEFLRKGTEGEDGYSAFSVRDPENPEETEPTRLKSLLDDRGIERVVVAGIATDYCVKETTLDAVRHHFEAIALSDGMRAVNLEEGDGERALQEMEAAGVEIG